MSFRYILIFFFLFQVALTRAQDDVSAFKRYSDSAIKYELIDYDLAFYYARLANDTKDSSYTYKDWIRLSTIYDTYYQTKNMYDSAFSINKQALRLATLHKDTILIAYSLNNMAGIYSLVSNHLAAVNIYKQAMHMLERTNDTKQLANVCFNLSIPFADLGMNDSALVYTNRAMLLYRKLNDFSGLASCYGAYGSMAYDRKEYEQAIRYYNLEVDNFTKANEPASLIIPYQNMADVYLKMHRLDDCKRFLDLAMNLSVSLGSKSDIYNVCGTYSEYYETIGDYKTANTYMKRYYEGRDTMVTDKLKLELSDLKSDFDKENAASQARIQKLETEKELRTHETIQWVLLTSLLFFVIVVVLFINRYRLKQRSFVKLNEYKNQLLIQKEKIEENQKEIIDSINYAKRIQSAILAKEEDIMVYFRESFLFYRPKHIVAGDFYFFEVTDTHVFYAAADCTGHGVPGALVSVVCSNALTRCVKEFNLSDPGKILDKARELVLETFQKSGRDVKDGMDISLLAVPLEQLHGDRVNWKWAGANNPLWYVRNGVFMEVVADKQPIGISEHMQPFTTHDIALERGDALYLFTDGYADQFGGPKGKKFKYRPLKEQLASMSTLPMPQQLQKTEQAFIDWKGDLEQVDDVLVLGIRIN
ncbi:MAG: SpoIIE family protein phosphatase [Bacteroidetes bacterium]|nr:SpoIIE family protein phosphatase [Bacteroidota bacterium]